jgi:hypothetical protein
MPSPFPGMDPYLEHPEILPDLHDSFTIYLREALQPRLPEPYYADIGQRVWVEISERYIEPDFNVLRARRPPDASHEAYSGTAVAAPPRALPVVVHVPHDERREPFVEIYVREGSGRRLVTTIEVLSLTNKTPGEHGRSLYLRKQQEILNSKVHLVEIDLLRAGEHTSAVPLRRAVRAAGAFDYHVCVHHYDNLEDYFLYSIRLEDRLPAIAIPLLPGDPAVEIDLQEVFHRSYDTGPYRREIDYRTTAPVPPLSPEQMEWAQQRLAAAFPGA